MRAALEAGLAQAGQTLTGEQIDRLCRPSRSLPPWPSSIFSIR